MFQANGKNNIIDEDLEPACTTCDGPSSPGAVMCVMGGKDVVSVANNWYYLRKEVDGTRPIFGTSNRMHYIGVPTIIS